MVKIGSRQHMLLNMTTKYSHEESHFQSAGTLTQRKTRPASVVAASGKETTKHNGFRSESADKATVSLYVGSRCVFDMVAAMFNPTN